VRFHVEHSLDGSREAVAAILSDPDFYLIFGREWSPLRREVNRLSDRPTLILDVFPDHAERGPSGRSDIVRA
jgi:hypothetical protein